LVVVLDLDRVLSGVFRVDPELRAVVARWPLPRTSTTALDVDRWFTRWQVAASPDARTLVLSAPGRVWQVDATTGTSRLLTRSNRVSALAATDRHIAVGESNGSLTLFDDGPRWRVQLDDAPIAVHLVDSRVVATTSTGRVVQLATEDGQALEPPVDVCCLSAVDSAVHPDGSEVMVACDAECGSAAERVSWVDSGTRVLEGAGTRHPGVSYSPSGRYLTTGGPDQGLLLWDAWTEQPLATFASGEVRTVSWSADENTLLTVDDTGLARLWDVHGIRRRGVQAR